jgi:hypothetical protein
VINKDSALGIFAANGLTELSGSAPACCCSCSLCLPRVGGGEKDDERQYDDRDKRGFSAKRVVERDRVTAEPSRRAG